MTNHDGDRTRPETSSVVGTWELVSMAWTYPDDRTIEPWGTPAGRLAYDATGNVVALLMHEARNEAGGRASASAVQPQYSAYFGTYRVDAGHGIITHRVAGSLNGTNASGELRRSFAFEGDDLILGFTTERDGVPVARRLVWRRISSAPAP
ncbi:lipocalin-like domain-containing protein [Paracraurococcus lichenis]|uniref:Lipocalin-like domain-containing protein n=1 Tax=Paracraurococcus lichenis TaxID=3064888 RepID=A0ABT9E5H4_9PROT|nr:lipocalin-like domain-containing protein [Paracraurococcus sp. LOR1-02]MDO9711398.1 lipocalin-like domain-containing protein [Paracraurococcus sp. LOR1-02]